MKLIEFARKLAKRRLITTVIGLGAVVVILRIPSCGGAVDETKLIGAWEIEGMSSKHANRRSFTAITNSVYLFNQDRTFAEIYMARDRTFRDVGTWELEGNVLLMTKSELINWNGSASPSIFPPMKVRVTALDEKTMTWKGGGSLMGLRLVRSKIQPSELTLKQK